MQYIIRAYDGPGMLEKRLAVRQRHLENIGRVKGKILCAGGLLDGNGEMKGSVLVMEFANRELLEEYLESEPYRKEQVWEVLDIPLRVSSAVTVSPIT